MSQELVPVYDRDNGGWDTAPSPGGTLWSHIDDTALTTAVEAMYPAFGSPPVFDVTMGFPGLDEFDPLFAIFQMPEAGTHTLTIWHNGGVDGSVGTGGFQYRVKLLVNGSILIFEDTFGAPYFPDPGGAHVYTREFTADEIRQFVMRVDSGGYFPPGWNFVVVQISIEGGPDVDPTSTYHAVIEYVNLSLPDAFEYSVTPSSGPIAGGTAVTIHARGVGFVAVDPADLQVYFSDGTGNWNEPYGYGPPATDVVVVDDDTVTCTAPAVAAVPDYPLLHYPPVGSAIEFVDGADLLSGGWIGLTYAPPDYSAGIDWPGPGTAELLWTYTEGDEPTTITVHGSGGVRVSGAGTPHITVRMYGSGGIRVSGLQDEAEFDSGTLILWSELLTSDDVLRVSAKVDLPDPATYYGGFKGGRVVRWGDVMRGLSRIDGQIESTSFSWTEEDTTRAYRVLLARHRNAFKDRPVTWRMIDDQSRRQLQRPYTVIKGFVTAYSPSAGLLFDFTCEDSFSQSFSLAHGVAIPQRLIWADDFPNMPQTTDPDHPGVQVPMFRPVPIIYGLIAGPGGQCPAIYVGTQTIGGTPYRKFLLAGHAVKSIDAIYYDHVQQTIATVAGVGGDWLIPGYAGWTAAFGATPYEDINGHRYTVVYGKGTAADTAAGYVEVTSTEKVVPVSFDVQGIESVGDGSGGLITDLLQQYLHCMTNWVLQSYETGLWLSIPTFVDEPSIPVLNRVSFYAAQAEANRRTANGYRGDFILGWSAWDGKTLLGGTQVTVRDLVAMFNVSADVNAGFNRKTQFFVSMEPSASTAADSDSTMTVTDKEDVVSGTFNIEDRADEHFNILPFQHTQDYFGRDARGWRYDSEVQDATSITKFGRKRAEKIQLPMIRGRNDASDPADYDDGTATATSVMARRLLRFALPPRYVTYEMGIKGIRLDLGDVVLLTHYEGVADGGWLHRPFRVMRHTINPENFHVTIEGFDLGAIFADEYILADETLLAADWLDADDSMREQSGYLADESVGLGEFTDASPGKRMT
jgi:IPT/TIG domain